MRKPNLARSEKRRDAGLPRPQRDALYLEAGLLTVAGDIRDFTRPILLLRSPA